MSVKIRRLKRLRSGLRAVAWGRLFQDISLMALGSLIIAVAINTFLAPARVPDGSFLAAGLIGQHYLGLPIGLTMLVLRVPAIVLGFRYLGGPRFLLRTGWVVVVMTAAIDLLAPYLGPVTDNQMLNVLYGAILGGIGGGLIYRGRGTTGGTGVVARVIQRFRGMPLSQIYLMVDGTGIALAGVVFGWESALFGILAVFVNGLAADATLEGPSVVRTVTIVTDRPQQVSQAIMDRMQRGVTAWGAEGMYTKQTRTVLYCTVSRPEVATLRQLVLETDPQAFVVIALAHQAAGGIVRDSF